MSIQQEILPNLNNIGFQDLMKAFYSIRYSCSDYTEEQTYIRAIHRAFIKREQKLFQLVEPEKFSGSGLEVLIINPVGDVCNLRCDYCYESTRLQAQSNYRMNQESMERILDNTFSDESNNIKEICIHGGEPLLAGFSFYEKLISKLASLNALENISLSIQTNGVLLNDKWLRFFKKHKFSIGISLDGDESIHNFQRKHTNGDGTYNEVIMAIRKIQDYDIPYGVISVITKKTLASKCSIDKILKNFVDLGIRNIDLHPALVMDNQNPRSSEFNLSQIDYSIMMMRVIDSWMTLKVPDLRVRCIEDILENLTGINSTTCYTSGTCSKIIGVGPDGEVSPCTRPFDREYNFGSLLKTGINTIETGNQFRKFKSLDDERQNAQRTCAWSTLCGRGNCPSERFEFVDGEKKQKVNGSHMLCNCENQSSGFPLVYKYLAQKLSEKTAL